MDKPRGILFDLGDTLIRTGFNRERGIEVLLARAHNPDGVSTEDVMKLADRLHEFLDPIRERSQVEVSCQAFHRILFERLGIGFDMSDFDLELEFSRNAHVIQPEPGSREMLNTMHDRGVHLGVVSNSMFSGDVLGWMLAQHDMLEQLNFIMSSADYGLRKPHPLLFQTALTKLGLRPSEVWFVGDNLENDIAGALNVGMTAVLYNKNNPVNNGPVPQAEVHGWDEFVDLFKGL